MSNIQFNSASQIANEQKTDRIATVTDAVIAERHQSPIADKGQKETAAPIFGVHRLTRLLRYVQAGRLLFIVIKIML
jgi:limonene-1,2-epoxide hydrolase